MTKNIDTKDVEKNGIQWTTYRNNNNNNNKKKQSKIHTERKKINEQTPNFYSSKFQENFQKKVQK